MLPQVFNDAVYSLARQVTTPHLHLRMLVVARHAGERDMAASSSLTVSACLGRQQVHLLYCSQNGKPETLPGSFSYVPCSVHRLHCSGCTGNASHQPLADQH